MTVCKVALANLGMWVRDAYFPATYAHATWHQLAPFFRLPGRIVWGRDTVQVELLPFNDRRLACNLAGLCQRVETARPRLPGGRRWGCVLRLPAIPRSPHINARGPALLIRTPIRLRQSTRVPLLLLSQRFFHRFPHPKYLLRPDAHAGTGFAESAPLGTLCGERST